MNGTLFIVATPIGNLEDITLRAIKTLKEVDLIAAEDTRKTQILLKAYNIGTPLTSYHSYNAKQKALPLIERLTRGDSVAIVSDSGTPGISDPGSYLIKMCIERNIPVTSVPGATAFVAALILSGKPTNKFVFEGFLSNKKGRRTKQLEELKKEERTVVLYESPHRIKGFLQDFMAVFGDEEIVLARELTKKFEEVKRERAREHIKFFENNKPKGEYVVVFNVRETS